MILIGLIFFSALFSCEDPSSLGIDLIDDNDDIDVLYSEIPLQLKVVQLDSINTTNRGIMMTGEYADLDFGNLKVQSYLRVLPPSAAPQIPETVLTADSVTMDFRLNYFFGPEQVIHELAIHQLNEQVDPERIYYSSDSTPFDPTSVIDSSFMISEKDTLISLDLSPLKDDLFAALKTYVDDSAGTAAFLEQFKGFTLITNPGSSAVLGFNNAHTESTMNLYYTTNDSVVNTVSFRYSSYYNQIIADYTGTELDGIQTLTDFEPASGNVYLQAGAGLVPKIDFQPYYDFIDSDTAGTIVINKAELVFDNLQALDGAIAPPLQMSFYYTDDTNEIIMVGDEIQFPGTIQIDQVYISATRNNLDPFTTSLRSVRAEFDTTRVSYSPEITLFLQFIADGALKREDIDKVLAMPYSFVEAPTSVRDVGRNVDRFIIEPNDVRLEIFYTKLK
ncbi:MAG: hypothetical protein DHS20C17_26860 [Cyclobacteriaceae bacterium]|nr:MAG: hypothetical protein DHS20C17_26860 [Cyclobacteriaceae bacterium]